MNRFPHADRGAGPRPASPSRSRQAPRPWQSINARQARLDQRIDQRHPSRHDRPPRSHPATPRIAQLVQLETSYRRSGGLSAGNGRSEPPVRRAERAHPLGQERPPLR